MKQDEKKIASVLEEYEVAGNSMAQQKIVKIGQKQIEKQYMTQTSFKRLTLDSLRFIRLRTWLIQFILLVMALLVIGSSRQAEDFTLIFQLLSGVVALSAVFFMEEIFKSFTYGMWELEQTFKYDLRQLTVAKLFAFGTIDLLLILVIAMYCGDMASLPFWRVGLYLLVPFNITCIVLFSILTIWRSRMTSFVFWAGAGMVIGVSFILSGIFPIYQMSLSFWTLAFVLTLGILLTGIIKIVKEPRWEII